MQKPVLERHEGITVVRDDLLPGGTKSRFLLPYLKGLDAAEIVYAGPCEGGAQVALAVSAYRTGKQATLFIPARKYRTAYMDRAADFGAKIVEIRPGYLSVVQARARQYCAERGAHLLPFGMDMPDAIERIADAARSIDYRPAEVWCATGSGVLMTALRSAFPNARIKAVEVGRKVEAAAYAARMPFSKPARTPTPFPSNPYYDAKAWDICRREREGRDVLFWNVAA